MLGYSYTPSRSECMCITLIEHSIKFLQCHRSLFPLSFDLNNFRKIYLNVFVSSASLRTTPAMWPHVSNMPRLRLQVRVKGRHHQLIIFVTRLAAKQNGQRRRIGSTKGSLYNWSKA